MKRYFFRGLVIILAVIAFVNYRFNKNSPSRNSVEKVYINVNTKTDQPFLNKDVAVAAAIPTPSLTTSPVADTERIREIKAALSRYKSVLGKINKEELEQEQEMVVAALEKAKATHLKPPKRLNVTDDYGNKWIKLQYENGEVRYEFP